MMQLRAWWGPGTQSVSLLLLLYTATPRTPPTFQQNEHGSGMERCRPEAETPIHLFGFQGQMMEIHENTTELTFGRC